MGVDVEDVIGVSIGTVIIFMILLCLCYCCPCCLWYKRRNEGTVYHTMPYQNTAGLTQQIVVNTAAAQPMPYAMPQNPYAVQQPMPGPYMMPGAATPSMMPPPPAVAMPMPMGQPPPYTEVAQMQTAAPGVDPQDAYRKQAAYNPNFNPSAP